MSAHIRTTEYLAELPVGTVIRATDGRIYERVESTSSIHRGWETIGSELDVHSKSINKPVAVLYTPQESPDA